MVIGSRKKDEDAMETQLFFDMLMMALVTSQERNEKEWAKLFFDAGFSDYKIKPMLGLRSIIEIFLRNYMLRLSKQWGGTRTVAKAIAKEFPQLECIVFDLPHVVAGLPGTNNLKYVGGSMFEAIPPADAILLKWIMHDWSHENCVKILKQCKEAIKGREGGKLIIIDMVMETKQKEDHESNETELLFDILMMVLYNSQERNEKEWAQLFFDVGFGNYKIIPMLGSRSIIEVCL
ncbi:probable O-methyltransferase 3 [Hevea brasiliensis]|uniref:probable O-methyltransferase 3 n=1 Tax=Hevea brasiliensis TaxID=3981 RepID=UPI0025EF51E2|nr:probable O-methyltransferase 3 [Hevea brasiliensis]